MESTKFELDAAMKSIAENGFYRVYDPTIGQRISDMERNKHQFSTTSPAGLQFYRDNVHNDERIRAILEKSLESGKLGDYRRIQEDRGHIFQLRRGGAEANVLVVQMWKDGCRGIYWRLSHTASPEALESVRAANRMWEVASAKLKRAGCERIPVDFGTSGFVILDARIAFETDVGSPITCSFAPLSQLQLQRWPRLNPPETENTDNLVEELQNASVGVYFAAEAES